MQYNIEFNLKIDCKLMLRARSLYDFFLMIKKNDNR